METLLDDGQLVSGFLAEDHRAIEQLDQWIRRAAHSFRFRLGACWEDELQEVRLEVFQLLRKGNFEGRSSLKSYVWQVANHTCIDFMRKKNLWKFTTLEHVANDLVTQPPRNLESADEARGLLRLLGKMPSECRKLWQMILSGCPYQQMSDQLNISEGTLRVRVHRCRKKAAALRDIKPGGSHGL